MRIASSFVDETRAYKDNETQSANKSTLAWPSSSWAVSRRPHLAAKPSTLLRVTQNQKVKERTTGMINPSWETARNHRHALRAFRAAVSRVARAALVVMLSAFSSLPASALTSETWVTSFIRFVEWPQAVADNTFIVCQPPDTPELDLTGKQVRGLTLLVLRVARPRDVSRCNVFVAWPQAGKPAVDWQPWIAAIGDKAILSIGASERFCELGGAVCVISDDATGRENYRVNLDVLARAGFKVNAQLLRKQFPRPAKAE